MSKKSSNFARFFALCAREDRQTPNVIGFPKQPALPHKNLRGTEKRK